MALRFTNLIIDFVAANQHALQVDYVPGAAK